MAGKSKFHANLPILDGKNWDTWIKQMKVIFIVQEADEQVNTVLDPLPANATEEQRTTFREAQKKDSKALFLIHQCVDSKVFEKIADATISKDAWDILQKSYGGDAKVKKVKLQALNRQFELLEMKSDEAISEYFTRVETLTNQMKNCGSTLSEEEMVEKVLRTLTHKFDHIVVTIEQTKDLSEIKMEDLQSTLEAHELKHGERNHGKEDEQALFVKFKKYQNEKKKWQNKKGSKKGKESVEEKPESSEKEGGGQNTKKDKSTIQCYSCNKYGHYASECKAPKKKKNQNTEAETNVGNKMVFCASLSQSRTVQVKFENSNSEVLIEEENDKSIKILRTGGASKHTSKESDSEHQKVHISEDVIMNEVHINEDKTRVGSTKVRESDVEAGAEVSAVEASVETRARSTRTKDWNAETKVEASEVEVNVKTEVRSTRKRQVPARWQECELANDSRVSKEGELMQCALLVDEPVTKSKAMTDVGILSCFLRNKLLRTRGLMLHQKKYAGEILRRFNMVESLVSRLKENTRKSHMNNVARRILRYIAGTLEFGIFLQKSARNAKLKIEIVWFSDADWCGEKVDRRSTSGYVFKFQNAPVSWCSKKQSVIALSSCEAEYVAGSLAACQANWLQSLLSEMKITDNITVMLKIDNKLGKELCQPWQE
ncbi:hypothetical protein TSUD_340540 [Trifolium subterraneum]|uniref:CCHC-type domain-containing protein n=1 Tax=Trifolium subterraneum TaxID=3900 RepID=A0A2Z6LJA2_TRISU|nr:hypothetical protein TSUD_340540 [Trifolium subterraneum]